MSLQKQIMVSLKEAMKSKDKVALESLRAIKSELLLAKTKGGSNDELSEEEEIKLLQKLVKQRKESAIIFTEQGREDLAAPELAQVAVIAKFLPEQMSEADVEKVVAAAVTKTGASSMKDMGKVMGMVSKELAGKADGKMISLLVKKLLA
ncbi:MAG: glutamyl-tRNA amidotransferase [Flavobacteriaceae bacterium]|nr:MAG: glutamyl-tRNA amidotransferase [Flavobacteriaceae bacterium]